MTGPRVLPQYYGGNMGAQIADAFYRQAEMKRQADIDAVTYGIGLEPVDPNAPPQHSALSRLAGAVYSRLTGHANGNDVEDATANMARHPVTIGTTPNASMPGTAMDETTLSGSRPALDERDTDTDGGRLPGAFDPVAGGFTPSKGSMGARLMRLPSGQTIDMRYTPYGQREEAREDTQAYNTQLRQMLINAQLQRTGQTLDTRRELATQHDQTMASIADKRIQAQQQLHNTPSGSVMFTAAHRPAPGASRTYAEDPAHRQTRQNFTATNVQLHDAQGQLRTVDASLAKPLPLLATPADSAQRRALVAEQPGLQQRVGQFRQLSDSLGAAMRGDNSVPGHLGSGAGSTSGAPDTSADEYAAAARAFQQAGGASNARARALYDRVVAAIAAKHGHR